MKTIILLSFTLFVLNGYAADDDLKLVDIIQDIQQKGRLPSNTQDFIECCNNRRQEVLQGHLLSDKEKFALALFFMRKDSSYPHPQNVVGISYDEYLKRIEPFLEAMKKGKETALEEGHLDDFGFIGYMERKQIHEKVFQTDIVKGGTPVKVGKNIYIIPRHDFEWEMDVTAPAQVKEWFKIDRCPNLLRPLFGLAPAYPFVKKDKEDEISDQDSPHSLSFTSPQRKVNLHHSAKVPTDEVIVSVPSKVHKDKTLIFHQGGSERPSLIDRSTFATEKTMAYQALALRVMIVDFENFLLTEKLRFSFEEENTEDPVKKILFDEGTEKKHEFIGEQGADRMMDDDEQF